MFEKVRLDPASGRWGVSCNLDDSGKPLWTLMEHDAGRIVRLFAIFPAESDAVAVLNLLAARDDFYQREVVSTGFLARPRMGALDA